MNSFGFQTWQTCQIRLAVRTSEAPSFLTSLPACQASQGDSTIPLPHFEKLLRDAEGEPAGNGHHRISYDGLDIDRRSHRANIDGHALDLTPTEFRILWELADRPGRVFSRNELVEICFDADKTIKKRTIDAHVKSIRRKLNARADLVETVRGIGDRLKETEPPVYEHGAVGTHD